MLEFIFCSMITLLPDYLFRRYVQGKRIGKEITFFSVWYELRWGITLCAILTISLVTVVFYYHPATSSAITLFRSIPIMPEAGGRVAEVYVGMNENVKAGEPLFKLDDSAQLAAMETARRKILEVEALIEVAHQDLAAAEGRVEEARFDYLQAVDELETKTELVNRNANVVTEREIEKLQNAVDGRKGVLDSAVAAKKSVEKQIALLLPAQRAIAEATLAQAQVDQAKTVVHAGVDGMLEQFTLRVGDVVNPAIRPAGILIPEIGGRELLVAGFGQIEAQVLKVGMIGEAACAAKPFVIVPLVVTEIQDVIAAGQLAVSERLVDLEEIAGSGTILTYLKPIEDGALDSVPPGSSCHVNVYTSNHERLLSEDLGTPTRIALHVVDTVGLAHAIILRIQALLIPVTTLVFSGGH